MKIYISSACVKVNDVVLAVNEIAKAGYRLIELTGGGKYTESLKDDLVRLKKQYGLEYLCHNYFPPPQSPFILNLASSNPEIYQRSIDHVKKTITWSRELGAKQLGVHAGFFIDIGLDEIGKQIKDFQDFDKESALDRFYRAYCELRSFSEEVNLYIENNVFSQQNKDVFGDFNPFMLTSYNELLMMRKHVDFRLLLDVAHLKVSCLSLGLNFSKELKAMINDTDYIHISDNNGVSDQNLRITAYGDLWLTLKQFNWSGKTITLEIYEGLSALKESYDLITGELQ